MSETSNDTSRCKHTHPDGTCCQARATQGREWCWFHDPDREQERQQARKKGGKQRSRQTAILPLDLPDTELKTVADVLRMLTEAANGVRKDTLDAKRANCLAYLGSVCLRAIEGSDNEQRLAVLEETVKRLAAAKQVPFRLVEGDSANP